LKSEWKPFQVVAPEHARIEVYDQEKTFYTFECWNHWPVSQLVSSGRPCVAPDRASHSSLSHIFWDTYETGEHMQSKLLMTGLTTKPIGELGALAKAWLRPPKVAVSGAGFRSEGFDPTQRAFVVSRDAGAASGPVELTLEAGPDTPLVNPAILVKGWSETAPVLKIDGKPVQWGTDVRYGLIRKLEGSDLVVWIRKESTGPVRVSLAGER